MEEKLKVKNIHIVFFFKNIIEFNSLELANKILQKIPDLGQPNILSLPDNVPNEIKMNVPRIVFNTSNGVSVNVTSVNLELNFFISENDITIIDIVSFLFDALFELGINVQAVGTVYDYINLECDFEAIKEVFYKDELSNCDLANTSWYKREEFFNVWKLINMIEKNDKKFLKVRIDVNNKGVSQHMTKEAVVQLVKESTQKANEFRKELLEKIGE